MGIGVVVELCSVASGFGVGPIGFGGVPFSPDSIVFLLEEPLRPKNVEGQILVVDERRNLLKL